MSRGIILYLGGGGMSGVFGGGVLQTLQEANAYPHIEAVYGASVGAFSGAYFLTHQIYAGRDAFLYDLPKGIVQSKGLLRGLWQRYKGRPLYPFHPDHYFNALHVDYISSVVTGQRALDLEKLVRQPIPFYVKVFNQHIHKIQHLDIHSDDPLKLLLAAAALPPYTFEFELIHHRRMIDSCLLEVIGLDYLVKKYPGHKIVVVLNRRPINSLSNFIACRLEAFFGSRMYGRGYYSYPIIRERRFRQEVAEAGRYKRVLLVMPPANSPSRPGTLDVKKLRKTFDMGKHAGRDVLQFIES